MSIISGITCKNGTALELTAPVSVDGTIVTIYNPGGNYAYLSGNLNVQGTTVLNGTSYIYDHNLVVQGAGIVIEPSSVQAASGLYIKNIADGPNQAYIDATTGTIGCRGGVYVQNSAGTALGYIDSYGSIYSTTIGGNGGLFVVNSANAPLGYIDSQGSIYTTSAGGGGGLYVRTSDNTENLARIDAYGNIFTTTGLFVQDSVGPSSSIIASINNAGYLSAQSAFIADHIIINSGGATIYNDTTINNGSLALKGTTTGLYIQNPAGTTMASIDNAGNLNVVAANVGSLSSTNYIFAEAGITANGNIVATATNGANGIYVKATGTNNNVISMTSDGTLTAGSAIALYGSSGQINCGYFVSSNGATINGTTNVESLSATGNISTNGHINNGLYNLAPIAYGLITNPSTLSKSYNVNSTPTTSNNSDITITITNPSLNGNYIPIITFTGLGYNQVVPIIEVNSTTSNTITFTSYQLRNSNNNQIITDGLPVNTWSFYFVVYGN